MTLIAYKNGVMASDSASFNGCRRQPTMIEKIACCPDGRIAGSAGMVSDCHRFNQWLVAGGKPDERPKFHGTGDDEIHILLATPDGRVWRGYSQLDFHEVSSPHAIGEGTAVTFCEAAMFAGLSAPDAVKLAIEHCVWIGGPVQVLEQPPVAPNVAWSETEKLALTMSIF